MTGHSRSGKAVKAPAIPFAEAQKLVHNTAHAFVAGKPSAEEVLRAIQVELTGAGLYDNQAKLWSRICRARQMINEVLEAP